MEDTPTPACKRCGTCCRKGGPALHLEDKRLVAEALLPIAALVTIRPGEPVLDNVAGRIISAQEDIIKIKSVGNSPACLFLEPENNTCSIYDHRPLECRILECWQPEKLSSIYCRNRLSRRDILMPEKAWLWNLVSEHQRRCDYLQVTRLARQVDRHEASSALLEIMRYDVSLRETCRREGGIDPGMLDFLFGLPLSITITRFGLTLDRTQEGRYRLIVR